MFQQDSANYFLNSATLGNLKLVEVKEIEIEDEAEVEAVSFSSDEERPSGFRRKKGAIMITLTETPGVPPQVDWYALKEAREVFGFTVQYRGGKRNGLRVQYTPCTVSKVSDANMNDDSESEREIVLLALGRREQ